MKKILKWGGIAFVVLIAIGVIVGGGKSSNTNSNNQSATSSSSTPVAQQTPTVVDATTLVGDYDKNKIAAQDKYTNKLVQITAYIKNISNDISGNYYLSLNPTNDQYYFGTSIACYFADKSAKSELTSLQNGQSVTVQGTMADMSIGTVVMNDCKVIQ